MKLRFLFRVLAAAGALLAGIGFSADSAAQSARALDARSKAVIDHWTPARINSAIPRDLVIDERGLGYLRGPGNSLSPYGHNISAQAGGGAGGDKTPPSISGMAPAAGATIGAAATFSATVTDASGLKSVTFYVRQCTGPAQTFAASSSGGNVYSTNLSGFTNGSWSWWVVAKDNAKPGNTGTSATLAFTVNTGTGGGGGGGTVPNAEWTSGGVVQNAAGRIYFEMPSNAQRTQWGGYVCSGTAVTDGTTNRSIILTAAHCVYDDANKAFARNVLFIPNQAATSAAGTDRVCSNDPLGCWTPNFGVVDTNWTSRTFPNNVHWDYAFYVVKDTGAHQSGYNGGGEALDATVTPMSISFATPATTPTTGSGTHALGYSYDVDPNFMYCTEPMENLNADNWWLGHCDLSGGSSGGPWVQPMNTSQGNGPVISVNSWGYTNQPGMAGPKLSGTTASCVFTLAKSSGFGTFADGSAGYTFSGSCP
jgi:hypothetical protein